MQTFDHRLNLPIVSVDRRSVRDEVVTTWLKEDPGDLQSKHRYRYDVEQLGDGNLIYLLRPTQLNKGIDFVIYCEGFLCWKNGNCKPPKHDDLISELDAVISNSNGRQIDRRAELSRALGRIWRCEKPELVLEDLRLNLGLRAERALKLARWFFIEQDLTYWTACGRWMLRGSIEKHLGVAFDA